MCIVDREALALLVIPDDLFSPLTEEEEKVFAERFHRDLEQRLAAIEHESKREGEGGSCV